MKEIAKFPSCELFRNPPSNFVVDDDRLFCSTWRRTIRPLVSYQIDSALVFNNAVYLPKEKRFATDFFSNPSKRLSKKTLFEVLMSFVFPPLRLPRACWITDNWSAAYFHWLTECLPRLEACLDSSFDHVVVVPHSLSRLRFVVQSLEMLGIKSVVLPRWRRVVTHDLRVAGPGQLLGNFHPQLVKRVRDRFHKLTFGDCSGKSKEDRIWVSRRNARFRRLLNENDLVPILEKYGFRVISLEEYSFEQQLRMMFHASHIAGVHGAGLANMMFLRPRCTVLEIRQQDDCVRNCYFNLSRAFEHAYFYALAKPNQRAVDDVFLPKEVLVSVLDEMFR